MLQVNLWSSVTNSAGRKAKVPLLSLILMVITAQLRIFLNTAPEHIYP